MRKIISITICIIIASASVFSQEPVRDEGKESVWHNWVYMNRVKLKPEWYHYWIWYKKVFGISIPMVGLGLHNSYAKEDRRTILELAPTIVTTQLSEDHSEDEHNEVDTMYQHELFKFADKTVDYQYTLTKNRRNELLSEIALQLAEYSSNGGNAKNAQLIMDEVTRINSNVDIIHDSHMSNAKKREAYQEFEKELVNVLALTSRMNKLNKSMKKYE